MQEMDKKKKKKGTLGVGNGAIFFASESDKVGPVSEGHMPFLSSSGNLISDPLLAPRLPYNNTLSQPSPIYAPRSRNISTSLSPPRRLASSTSQSLRKRPLTKSSPRSRKEETKNRSPLLPPLANFLPLLPVAHPSSTTSTTTAAFMYPLHRL